MVPDLIGLVHAGLIIFYHLLIVFRRYNINDLHNPLKKSYIML